MVTIELILLLIIAVLLSSIFDQIIPKISLPLFQILAGVVIAFLSISPVTITIDPEYFLLLFIAPLLFSESLDCDKKNLWDNKVPIVSLAIGLVVAITLIVGFALNLLVPSIPLAAAFALGAALGPTDAAAVQALSKEARFGKHVGAMLQGEALLNDASGVVSFQFAVAAVTTGTFSLLSASETFVFSFVGGIVLGILLAFLCLLFASKMRSSGLENVTFHVLFEISIPFIAYLIAEHLGVSGILAVVACGIVWSTYNSRKLTPINSKLSIAVSSVWKTISFALNGIVFVLLGTQLPQVFQTVADNHIDIAFLAALVVAITALVIVIRFIWSLIMLRSYKNPDTNKREKLSSSMINSAAVITFGGAKGAVTLSIVFSIPLYVGDGIDFPYRWLLILIAGGVIVLTLLIANFALPLLCPKREATSEELEDVYVEKIEILKEVISKLLEQSDETNEREIALITASYNNRIERMRDIVDIEQPSSRLLRIEIINYQATRLIEAAEAHEISSYEGFAQLKRLFGAKDLLAEDSKRRLSGYYYGNRLSNYWNSLRYSIVDLLNLEDSTVSNEARILVRQKSEEYALEYLYPLVGSGKYPADIIAKQIIHHERALTLVTPDVTGLPLETSISSSKMESLQKQALSIEAAVINEFYAEGKITRSQAQEMRKAVSLMLVDLEET